MEQKRYKVMVHKMVSIDRKRTHSYPTGIARRFATGQEDYSPMEATFEVEVAANSKLNESIKKVSKEFAGTPA